jgi:acyl-CoA synthetase (AMP-forming)/AMP-acid ligase II
VTTGSDQNGVNVARGLVDTARRNPVAPAVTWGPTMVTYGDLDRRSDAFAAAVVALGVGPGDRVGVHLRNRPELLEAMYGCFKAGGCLVPLNRKLTPAEVQVLVADADARVVVTDDEVLAAALVTGEPGDGPSLPPTVIGVDFAGPDVVSFDELTTSSPGPVLADVAGDDVAWLFYTSGTTGVPKGAMLTHTNLTYLVAAWLADVVDLHPGDVTLHAAPLSHGAGFHALAATARGVHHVIDPSPSFDADAVLGLLADHAVTSTWLVPTQIVLLTDAAAATARSLPALRAVVYGGAPITPAELRRAVDTFGQVFVQIYAQGEAPMTTTVLSRADHLAAAAGRDELWASAGTARVGTDVRVVGPDGVEVPAGEVGEVCVRGPAVMAGYWQRPDATAETLAGGWLHTGDLGRVDDRGYLYLLDRAKDLIITGGSNVYAVEVEAVLAAVAGAGDIAVVGVPDRVWGEIVTAVATGHPALEPQLRAACEATLASYKRPRRYAFVAELPRNAYGKVVKRDLRSRLAGELDSC